MDSQDTDESRQQLPSMVPSEQVQQIRGSPPLIDFNHKHFNIWLETIMESSRSSSSCSNTTASDMCDMLGATSSPYPRCKVENCEREGKHACVGCLAEYYCSREHQVKDWKHHRLECKSVSLVHEKLPSGGYATTVGYAVQAGEVVSIEKPLVVLPCKSANPGVSYCVNCGASLKMGETFVLSITNNAHNVQVLKPNCELCEWPCCPGGCVMTDTKQKNRHTVLECSELNEAARTGTLSWVTGENVRYHFLWILRMALLKKRDPERFAKMMLLADFDAHEDLSYITMDIYGKLHNALPIVLTSIGSDELLNIFKILCHRFLPMNFEIPPADSKRVRGLFYESSMISHSCYPNLAYTTDPHHQQRIFALKPLEAGTPVSISYDAEGILLATFERRKRLIHRHNLWCNCERCSDDTEFQTYYSVLPCGHHKANAYFLFPSGKEFAKARRSEDSFHKGFSNGWSWKPEAYVMMADPSDENKGVICSSGKACPGHEILQTISWKAYREAYVQDFVNGLRKLPSPSNCEYVALYLTTIYVKKMLPCTNKIFFDTSKIMLEELYDQLPGIGFSFIYGQLFLKFVVPAESVYRIFKVFHNDNVTLSTRALRMASLIRLAHIAYDIRIGLLSMSDLEQRIRQVWITQNPVELTTLTQSGISTIMESLKNHDQSSGKRKSTTPTGPVTVEAIEACAAAVFYSSFGDLLRKRHLQRLIQTPVTCRQESAL